MILACNQPYFIPYIGYWQLINCADVFVIGDDYAYINRGWVNRNRILNQNEPMYFGLPLVKASQNKYINEITLADMNFDKLLKTISYNYCKSPNFHEGFDLLKRIFECKNSNLAYFLGNSMEVVCDYLNIKTRLCYSSSFPENNLLKREFRIYDFCAKTGADTYINSIGGTALYDFDEFRKRNLTLKFIKSNEVTYKQFNNEFVPWLSILDVIMFNSRDEVIRMLNEYKLIDNKNDIPAAHV